MIKAIPNRTIGLQKKQIEDKFSVASCLQCSGAGHTRVNVPAGRMKNLKLKVHFLEVENECEECNGTGKIHSTVRVIRKNKVTAIVS
jgi:DnaJ-class molecular chaperone